MSQFLSNCSVDALATAAKSLREGSLVAFPTETVYGLGADATNVQAVARIYEAKGRPVDHPLIVHIADLKYLEQWISDIPEYAIVSKSKYSNLCRSDFLIIFSFYFSFSFALEFPTQGTKTLISYAE